MKTLPYTQLLNRDQSSFGLYLLQQLYVSQAWIFQAPSAYPPTCLFFATQAPLHLPSSVSPTQSSSFALNLRSSHTPLLNSE
ncbi:hypothetical protein Bca4012_020511 [Brassica carinata]